MPTLLIDLNTLYRIMLPKFVTDQAPIFWYQANSKYIFYGYKGPIVLKSVVSVDNIISVFSNSSGKQKKTEVRLQAIQKFSEMYLSRAIKIEGEESITITGGEEHVGTRANKR